MSFITLSCVAWVLPGLIDCLFVCICIPYRGTIHVGGLLRIGGKANNLGSVVCRGIFHHSRACPAGSVLRNLSLLSVGEEE